MKFCNSKFKNRKVVKNAGHQKKISIYTFTRFMKKSSVHRASTVIHSIIIFLATNDNSLFLKIAKNYFRFGLCSYTNQFQWHRLLPLFATFYKCQTVFLLICKISTKYFCNSHLRTRKI